MEVARNLMMMNLDKLKLKYLKIRIIIDFFWPKILKLEFNIPEIL